jgi:hypothetical protein
MERGAFLDYQRLLRLCSHFLAEQGVEHVVVFAIFTYQSEL